jgi:hypothetical protein
MNHEYFSHLDLKKCYLAGFFAADGYIAPNKKSITINLQEKDKVILDLFKEEWQSSLSIKKGHNKTYDTYYYRFNCTSEQICNDLNTKFNITTKKSLTLMPPNLYDLQMQLAYIVGYIDGDGCVGVYNGIPILDICGTESFLIWIKSIFDIVCPSRTSTGRVLPKKNGLAFGYRVGGARLIRLWRILSNLDIPSLDRKWSILSTYDNSKSDDRFERYNTKKNEIKILLNDGLSVSEISKITGIPFQTIYKWKANGKL